MVDDAWRELYSAISTCKALRLYREGLYEVKHMEGLLKSSDLIGNNTVFRKHFLHVILVFLWAAILTIILCRPSLLMFTVCFL